MSRITRLIATAAVGLAVGACSGGDDSGDGTATTTTTEPAVETIDVRVTAEQVLGCTESRMRSGLDIGTGSRMTVEDGAGGVLGTATMDLTPGAEICDWTATFEDVDATADFYRFDAGGEVATVSRDELSQAGWAVTVHISITGSPTLE